ncbi:hypothetical protein TNIN_358941 [Trichonephila inaurata madagascariensis]|uniref:Uncharacterized protein n=1 Tax=Trichonephila inaurata madagascariensis TaxID=2747483 RepID=A0A8X6WYC1_9ARAC|nr:hypothetical protein TNIN_358941 [Trichonephila inaurata madagascariensis]
MKTCCLKCGENHRSGQCEVKEKIENPLCINRNNRGHMASSTECPLFPKPRKGTGKSATENRKRNEINQKTTPTVIPGFTFAQVSNPNKSQQMAAQGNASSASNQNQSQAKNSKNEAINMEAINAIQNDSNEFGFLQAILEIQKNVSLFPSLLSEMKISYNCTNPADKLNCLLKGVCAPLLPT